MTWDQFVYQVIAWMDQFLPFWRAVLIGLVVFYVAMWVLFSLPLGRGED
jgi:p-aminobenzoyl-glutamate transporter AbgT